MKISLGSQLARLQKAIWSAKNAATARFDLPIQHSHREEREARRGDLRFRPRSF